MSDDVIEIRSPFSLEKKTVVHEMTQFLTRLLRCFNLVSEVANASCNLCGGSARVRHLTRDHLKEDHSEAVDVARLRMLLLS